MRNTTQNIFNGMNALVDEDLAQAVIGMLAAPMAILAFLADSVFSRVSKESFSIRGRPSCQSPTVQDEKDGFAKEHNGYHEDAHDDQKLLQGALPGEHVGFVTITKVL